MLSRLGLCPAKRRATIIDMTEERATVGAADADIRSQSFDDETARHARIRELLANPGHHGGDSVRFIREMREARFGAKWRSRSPDDR